jgi:cobalt-zinc-cadmium efflux system protein
MLFHAAPFRSGANRTQSVLRFSLVATLAYVAVTFATGLRAHSLALISEAGHNLSDFLALLLSYAAVYFQSRPAGPSKTFGYQRAGVLAAFLNAGTLIVISIWIGLEALHRLSAPVTVQPRLMMIVAAAGVVINGVIAALLWRVAREVNLRSAFLHMAGDTLSTAAVIAGGAGILLTGRNWIDPALSLVIAALILWTSMGIVRETLNLAHTDSRRHGSRRGSGQRSRPARLEPGLELQRPGLPRDHRRHSAVGERLHTGAAQPGAQGTLPHPPRHHPI